MYIVVCIISIGLMLLITYRKHRLNCRTSIPQKILFGCGIFCSVGGLILLNSNTKDACLGYSSIASILYCIYIFRNREILELDLKNLKNKTENNKHTEKKDLKIERVDNSKIDIKDKGNIENNNFSNKEKNELKEKIKYIFNVAEIMEKNDIGYEDFCRNSEDGNDDNQRNNHETNY